jgi:hypothetical protein
VVLLPPQRQSVGGPERHTVLVAGSASDVGEAVRRASRAGWDTWAVARQAGSAWLVTLARRD